MRKTLNQIIERDNSIITDAFGDPILDSMGHIQRRETTISRFEVCNVATEFKEPSDILKRFYFLNPTGRALGFMRIKQNAWQDGDILCMPFTGNIIACVYEDTMADSHLIQLKVESPFDGKRYTFATGKKEIKQPIFQRARIRQDVELMVRLRQFSMSVRSEDISIPWE